MKHTETSKSKKNYQKLQKQGGKEIKFEFMQYDLS